MNIYITRHGETEWNKRKLVQGWKDSPLTEAGLLGAKQLRERMKEVKLDCVVSSPLFRAYETATIIVGDRAVPIVQNETLKEINCGDFEGYSFIEIWQKYPEMKKAHELDPLNFKYPNGESLVEFNHRVVEGFKKLIEKHHGQDILIVAHGGTIKGLTSYMIEKADPYDWFKEVVDNCSLTTIQFKKSQFSLVEYNDTSHLKIDD